MQNNHKRRFPWLPSWLLCALCAVAPAEAGPAMAAGDSQLRHDVQLLADHGLLPGPVTTWPLAWGPVLEALREVDPRAPVSLPVATAVARLKQRARWETRLGELTFSAAAGVAEKPMRIRGFENTPRETVEVGGGLSWTGDVVAVALQGQVVDRVRGGTDARLDGSLIGLALGNWSLSVNTLDRWWGPGWDGSLILSNNARPMPAVAVDRIFTNPFDSRWLRWLGPWDLSVAMGQLEADRAVPNALWFGMRFNFRPLPSLEIGLSRAAQWCGDDRPCDASVFADLLLGQDNIGDDSLGEDNEPGNQLAGADFRWSRTVAGLPAALYGQLIGEDEAGGLPSRFIGQFGVEASGAWQDRWSWRWFGEFAGTSCQFHESSELFNCAYNHGIYRTGYRYRGRAIGHGADNDARLFSTGLFLVDEDETQWRAVARFGKLNRGPGPDPRNTLTPLPQDIWSIDLSHRRIFRFGLLDAGIGYERTANEAQDAGGEVRVHLAWRSSY